VIKCQYLAFDLMLVNFQKNMSDSESSSDMERVYSNPVPVEHDTSPREIDFPLRLRAGGKIVKLLFILKKGVKLPYTPEITTPGGLGINLFIGIFCQLDP
jgi:hypothetical protein